MARLQKKKAGAGRAKKKDAEVQEGSAGVAGDGSEKKAKPSVPFSKSIGAAAKVYPADPNFIQKGLQFFREVRVELKKVTWPSRKQTTGSTVVVIVLVFIIAAFLGLVDFGLSKLVQAVLA